MTRLPIALFVLLYACPSEPTRTDTSGDEDIMFPDERAAAQARHPASALVASGERKLAAGDLAGATSDFEAAVAENDEDPRAHLNLGLARELANDYEPAEASYRRALELDPEFTEAMNNLGLLLRDRERYDEAIPLLERAVSLRERYGDAWLNLAYAREESGNAEGALVAYRRATELMPSAADARTNLGLLLLRQGDRPAAAQELRRALPLARGDAALLFAIGGGLRRAGEAEEAIAALDQALAATEEGGAGRPVALLAELALARNASGDAPGGIELLREAVAAQADFATGHFLLGSLLASTGEVVEARTHLERSIALEPEGAHVARAREALAALQAN